MRPRRSSSTLSRFRSPCATCARSRGHRARLVVEPVDRSFDERAPLLCRRSRRAVGTQLRRVLEIPEQLRHPRPDGRRTEARCSAGRESPRSRRSRQRPVACHRSHPAAVRTDRTKCGSSGPLNVARSPRGCATGSSGSTRATCRIASCSRSSEAGSTPVFEIFSTDTVAISVDQKRLVSLAAEIDLRFPRSRTPRRRRVPLR